MEKVFVGIAALVFGPVLIGAFANAVWPGLLQLLQYIFWFFVAIAALVGVVIFGRKLSDMNTEERLQRELEEKRQRTSRQQREELEALHTQVRNAHNNVFDIERRRAPPRIGQ